MISSIEKFLVFFINQKLDENNWSDECLKLIEIFFPLYLLREKSGILLLTYDKFETEIQYFKHNSKKWIKQSEHLDKYVVQNANNSTKFVLAFDEQEDGYKKMLEKRIDIISPDDMAINNALSSMNREFALLFAKKNEQNRELLNFLDRNQGAYREFQEYLEKGKVLPPQLQKYLKLYQKITTEEGNSIKFIQYLISINKGLEESLTEITTIFDSDEESSIALDFEMLSRVLAKFKNSKTLLIHQELYNKIGDDLMNIFSYNNLYIYNIESLQNLYLSKASQGHVHITSKKVYDKTSVAELIYGILTMRSQVEKSKKILANVLDAKDSQSHALDTWSQQISKVKKADEDNATQSERGKNPYLDRKYVYESNKSIINIKEISRYQDPKNNLIDPTLREVSIGSTAIFTSPEHKIRSIVTNNANVVFFISATGGIFGDLTTSYDMGYLEDKLLYESGKNVFKTMVESEILLCEEIREYRQQKRKITVDFFSQDVASFPNDKTKEVAARFESLILKDFIRDFKVPNIYKKIELSRFIYFLFYLFEDDSIRETIAFTQTLSWIKQLIEYCIATNNANFIFEESPEHPSIYYVQIKHKQYRSNIRIKLIFYYAQFNRDYYSKTNQKTYLDELVEQEREKIFFISAYQSASKGLNPIIKTQDGIDKDFDCLVLLMDAFYTDISSSSNKKSKDKKADKTSTIRHFALMKKIVKTGDSNLEIKDFNKYLRTPEASTFFQQQHQILLGKGIVQAIGRSERRDFDKQVLKIFINDESKKNLETFYKYLKLNEPDEIKKLSVNNYEVYQGVLAESKKQAINNYDDHIYDEIDADKDFQEFKHKMLNEIQLFHQQQNTFDVRKAWDGLRDATVFKSPSQYLDNLRKLAIFPDEFIDSLFYSNLEQPEFTPYIAWEEENGKKFPIISDSLNGERIYTYQNRLYPEYIKTNSQSYDLEGNEIELLNSSTKLIGELYNNLIPQPEVFDKYIPRYNFFYDILYPSLTENFVEGWIKDVIFEAKSWKVITDIYGFEQLTDFTTYPQLYEQFDLYYFQNEILFCIDVKAWSKASDSRLSKTTISKAKKKLKTIAENYPEFNAVKGLLLNIHASKEKANRHSSTLFSGNLIYADSHNCPVESTVLKNFLFQKPQ